MKILLSKEASQKCTLYDSTHVKFYRMQRHLWGQKVGLCLLRDPLEGTRSPLGVAAVFVILILVMVSTRERVMKTSQIEHSKYEKFTEC